MTLLKRLRSDEAGQDLAEYGIALAVIAGIVALIAVAIGQDVQSLWQHGQTAATATVDGAKP